MAEAAREMTPEELFDKAMSHRRTWLSTGVSAGDDVPMLSLMADQRAHRRADAKLDRLLDQVETIGTSASEFRSRYYRDFEDAGVHRGVVYLLGVITGVLTGVLFLRLLGV